MINLVKQVVSYVRVSTQRQGRSGLGLEAQQNAVATFCKEHGCEVIREFREVESGRKNDRLVLREAIRYAKQTKSVLLIAKIDRLARNVAFIANLMETDVQFRACDLPEANRLLLHIMAAIAEHEAHAISQRTRDAFAAAKARGSVLGAANVKSRNLTPDAMARGAQVTKAKAAEFYADVLPVVVELRERGLSLAKIAETLTERGHLLRSGARWNAVQVSRLLDRAA
jgi:DNA invertase Pin-like site-specific DNA recombinase